MTKFIQFFKDESGASAAEYALILALVGIGIVTSAGLLGGAIEKALDDATTAVNTR